MVAPEAEVSGPGVALVTDSVLAPAELAGADAEDAVLTALPVVALFEAEDAAALLPLLQVRLYKGAALKSDPIMPNDGLGVVGWASCRMYQ